VFRGLLISIHIADGYSTLNSILITPCYFGLAHLHHAWDCLRLKKMDTRLILLNAGFQFLYTTLFGWYAALIFAKTGLLLPAIVAHSLCNYFGLPSIHSNGNSISLNC
jgi:prenyl protein peptidase